MKPRALIAESDAAEAVLYSQYLRRHGWIVSSTADGVGCCQRLLEAPPKLLVLEWELPFGGGEGVLARLQEDWLWPEVFVIVTSKQRLPFNRSQLAELGVGVCLRKPFPLKALRSALAAFERRWPSVLALEGLLRMLSEPAAGFTGAVRKLSLNVLTMRRARRQKQ